MHRTVGTPIAEHNGTIFLAIELSQKGWLMTLRSPDKGKLSRYRLEGGDHVELVDVDQTGSGAGGSSAGQAFRRW